jgi:FkbM family methyltransferase
MPIKKRSVRNILARFGYMVRSIGPRSSVAGVEMLHDVRVLLGGKPNAVLFDVGANIGQTIDEFLAVFPSARIVAFEPSPASFQVLSAKYRVPGISLETIALGDSEGTLPFYVDREWPVNDSLLPPVWKVAQEVRVPVETLDGYCERHNIQEIDLLKIDTQGNDLNVLRGARQMLSMGRIRLFSVEIMFTPMYEGQPELTDFFSFAEQAKYRLVGFYEQTFVDNRLSYLNVCFQRAKG